MRAIEVQSAPPKLFVPAKPANLQLLELSYEIFLKTRIVDSQSEFSTHVLKMKPSYFSCMRARNRSPKKAVILRILNAARFYHAALELNKYFGKPEAKTLNKTHRNLEGLINTIESELIRKI